MNAYEKEYEVLSNRAKCTRKSWGYREQEANANDQTQQTFLRYFEKGFESKLDPSKGSAGTLLGGIFRLISKESSRAHGREATLPESVSVTLKDHSIGLLDALIEKEQRNFLFGCLPQLTEREQLALARYLAPERSRLLPSDYVAKHRAIKKLRLWAREKGLLDNE